MVVLEDLFVGSQVDGIAPNRTVTIIAKTVLSTGRLKVWYDGGPDKGIVLTRDHEVTLDMVKIGPPIAGPPDPNLDHYTLGTLMSRGTIVSPLQLEAPYVDDDGAPRTLQARVYRDGYIVYNGFAHKVRQFRILYGLAHRT